MAKQVAQITETAVTEWLQQRVQKWSWSNRVEKSAKNLMDDAYVVEVEVLNDCTADQILDLAYSEVKRRIQDPIRKAAEAAKDPSYLARTYPYGKKYEAKGSELFSNKSRKAAPTSKTASSIADLKEKQGIGAVLEALKQSGILDTLTPEQLAELAKK